jgi:hypothetical protein
MTGRPDFTMVWLCTFQIGAKREDICFLTDDFETVLAEFERIKKESKDPVIFVDHKLMGKGKMLLAEDMYSVEVVKVQPDGDIARPPIIDAEQPLRGQAQRIRNAVRNNVPMAELRHDQDWMGQHNRDMARHMLREPPVDKI